MDNIAIRLWQPAAKTGLALRGLEIHLEKKVESIQDIMSYGEMSTPGVVIDGQVVHAGGVPDRTKVEGWLA